MDFSQVCKTILGRHVAIKQDRRAVVLACLQKLGNPQLRVKMVHVTGTNGKGSVCALVAGALSAAGYKTGLFISPHLAEITERISIDGAPIPKNDFTALVNEVLAAETEPLVFFEVMTCAAFLYFNRRATDIAVMEVGIGGRLDSTNVSETTILSIITSVGIDHSALLGATAESVAFEKAGIIKKGAPCLCGPIAPAAEKVVAEQCAEKGAPLFMAGRKDIFPHWEYDWELSGMKMSDIRGESWRIGLVGEVQVLNASLAVKAAVLLADAGFKIGEQSLRSCFENIKWLGRFQVVHSPFPQKRCRNLIVDGSHNPAAAAVFASTFASSPYCGNHVLLLGVFRDKDCVGIVNELKEHLSKVIITAPPSERALPPQELERLVRNLRPDAEIEVVADVGQALSRALEHDTVAATGSFYLAGYIIGKLAENTISAGENMVANC